MKDFEFIMIEKIENKFFSCVTLENGILNYHDMYLFYGSMARHNSGSGGVLDSNIFFVENCCLKPSEVWVNPRFEIFLKEKESTECIDPVVVQGECPLTFEEWENMIVEDLEYPQIEARFYDSNLNEVTDIKLLKKIYSLFEKAHEITGGISGECTIFYFDRDEKGYPLFDDFETIMQIAVEKYKVDIDITFISD